MLSSIFSLGLCCPFVLCVIEMTRGTSRRPSRGQEQAEGGPNGPHCGHPSQEGQIRPHSQFHAPRTNFRATSTQPPQAGAAEAHSEILHLQGQVVVQLVLGCAMPSWQVVSAMADKAAHFGMTKSTRKVKECQCWPQVNECEPVTGLCKKIVPI